MQLPVLGWSGKDPLRILFSLREPSNKSREPCANLREDHSRYKKSKFKGPEAGGSSANSNDRASKSSKDRPVGRKSIVRICQSEDYFPNICIIMSMLISASLIFFSFKLVTFTL